MPRLAGAVLIALIALCAFFIPQVKFDDNVNRVFMSDSIRADEFTRTLNMIGAGRSDVIVRFGAELMAHVVSPAQQAGLLVTKLEKFDQQVARGLGAW